MTELILKENGASSEIEREQYALDLQGIEKWLKRKTILKEVETLILFHDIDKWFRSGSETYATTFQISYRTENQIKTKKIIIKALVSMFPDKALEKWQKRRSLLQENGIKVSNWYWCGQAIIIEDFYPFCYEKTTDFKQLIYTAKMLDKLGFHALDFLRDMRCDEEGNAYYIDFGFDLGGVSQIIQNISIEKLKSIYPQRQEEIDFF